MCSILTNLGVVGPGQVWVIYPFRKNKDGSQGTAELLVNLGEKEAKESTAIYSNISADGTLAYFTITVGSHIATFDISDLESPERLDDPDEEQPIIGPHCVKIYPDKKNLLVTGYFVQVGDISALNPPAAYKAHWVDILEVPSVSIAPLTLSISSSTVAVLDLTAVLNLIWVIQTTLSTTEMGDLGKPSV